MKKKWKKLKHCPAFTTQTVVLSRPDIFTNLSAKVAHPCCLVHGHKAHHRAQMDGRFGDKWQSVSLYWLS
jgi:hypothetical protein